MRILDSRYPGGLGLTWVTPISFQLFKRESGSSLTTLLALSFYKWKSCAVPERSPLWRAAGEMHEALNSNNCMLPCSYYLLRPTSPSGSWPSSESSHVLMWLLEEGWFLPYLVLVMGQHLPQTCHWSGIIGRTKPTKSRMVKLKICRWRSPPPPPPTCVVLYVEATVCLKPSSPQLFLCQLFQNSRPVGDSCFQIFILPVTDQALPKICSGNLMPFRPSFGTCTGLKKSLESTWNNG